MKKKFKVDVVSGKDTAVYTIELLNTASRYGGGIDAYSPHVQHGPAHHAGEVAVSYAERDGMKNPKVAEVTDL